MLGRGKVRRWRSRGADDPQRITMLLENNPYPQDTRVRNEAESLVAAGHRVEVIAPRAARQPTREVINGITVRRYATVNARHPRVLALLVEYAVALLALHLEALRALAKGSTVLHMHNPPDLLFGAAWIFRMLGRSVVYDHHDLCPELVEVKLGRRYLVRLARFCERLSFASANHVLATNESHFRVAHERGGKGSDEVTVVRNGPPVSWISLPVHIRGGKLDPVRLAYVGAISNQDGVEGIADVLWHLAGSRPRTPALLTIIGAGDAQPELESALVRRGVASAVTITGWVAPEQVPRLLQEADVCVDPAPGNSLNHASTMIKLAEYLALGKPVVAYDLRETRHTVADAGLLVPADAPQAFAEAIRLLAQDEKLRAELSERARQRARELTWERSEGNLLAAYASLRRSARDSGSSATFAVSPARD